MLQELLGQSLSVRYSDEKVEPVGFRQGQWAVESYWSCWPVQNAVLILTLIYKLEQLCPQNGGFKCQSMYNIFIWENCELFTVVKSLAKEIKKN